jgi:hypothetical protein
MDCRVRPGNDDRIFSGHDPSPRKRGEGTASHGGETRRGACSGERAPLLESVGAGGADRLTKKNEQQCLASSGLPLPKLGERKRYPLATSPLEVGGNSTPSGARTTPPPEGAART